MITRALILLALAATAAAGAPQLEVGLGPAYPVDVHGAAQGIHPGGTVSVLWAVERARIGLGLDYASFPGDESHRDEALFAVRFLYKPEIGSVGGLRASLTLMTGPVFRHVEGGSGGDFASGVGVGGDGELGFGLGFSLSRDIGSSPFTLVIEQLWHAVMRQRNDPIYATATVGVRFPAR